MKKIFLAFIFLIIELEYETSFGTVSLVPKFLGYILLVIACREYKQYSEKFSGVIPVATAISLVSFALQIYSFVPHESSKASVLIEQTILTTGYIIVCLNLMEALKDLQDNNRTDDIVFNYKRIVFCWVANCIGKVGSIAFVAMNSAFTLVFLCLSFVSGIALLMFFYANNELYDFDNFRVIVRKGSKRSFTAGEPILVLLTVLVVVVLFIYPRFYKKDVYKPDYAETFTLSYVYGIERIDNIEISPDDRIRIIELLDFENHKWRDAARSSGSSAGYYVYFNSNGGVIWIPEQKQVISGETPIIVWDKENDFYKEAYYDVDVKSEIREFLATYI